MMEIIEVREVHDGLVNAFNRLIPQLDPTCASLSRTDLEEIVASPVCHLFIAQNGNEPNEIIATLTLVVYRIPAGMKAWIEDLVVDEHARRQGVATDLIYAALKRAAALGAYEVHLTSAPRREAANRLYKRLAFEISGTNVYQKTTSALLASFANHG